jgi:hypothetical protein
MSLKERALACGTCFGLSIAIDLLSWGSMIGLVTGNPTRFALSYTFSQILSIMGTGFLLGFRRQFSSIFDKKRWITSTIWFLAMIGTLFSALVLKAPALVLSCIIVQVCAFTWYIASYLPFGRD